MNLFRNQTKLAALYVFDSSKINVREVNLFRNQTEMAMLYVTDSQKKK